MKKIALIVAAGNGTRMNNQIPKQFLLINHKPILYYTIKSFLDAYDDMEIILVLPQQYMSLGQEIIDGFFDNNKFKFCEGGRTRFHSVQNGLAMVDETDESIILVHDGVRCLLTPDLIHRCHDAATEVGTAIPVIPCKDSVRMVDEENENSLVDRNTLRLVQTPQTFHNKILQTAFKIDYKDQFTDEASVVEAFGIKLNLIMGEEHNIKITTPIDLAFAEILLSE